MVTQTEQTPPRSARTLDFLVRTAQRGFNYLKNLPRSAPQFFRWLWTSQRHWLIPLVPFLFLLYRPFHMAWGIWTSFDSPLAIQIIVPLLSLYIAWESRHQTASSYRQFCTLWPPESKRRRGAIWIALLGCLVMIIASVAIVPSLAVLGLVVTLIGIIYYVYGWYVVTLLWAPLVFLLLMTPPGNLLYRLMGPFQMGNSVALSGALHPLFPAMKTIGPVLLLPNTRLIIKPELSGMSVAIPILILAVWLSLRRNVRYFNYPVVLLLSLVIALIVNFVRLFLLALILNSSPVFGENLMKLNSWLLVLIAFLLIRPLVNMFQPRVLSSLGEGDNTL